MDISAHEVCLCPDCDCETRSECQMSCGLNNQCDCCKE